MLVRQFAERHVRTVEAQILADADNLDGIGSVALWNLVRRHAFEGKGIEAALRTWRRQREFRFWEARINKSVHFEPVKRLAFQRLREFDQVMSVLARHHEANDLADFAEQAAQPTS